MLQNKAMLKKKKDKRHNKDCALLYKQSEKFN